MVTRHFLIVLGSNVVDRIVTQTETIEQAYKQVFSHLDTVYGPDSQHEFGALENPRDHKLFENEISSMFRNESV